MEKIDKKSSVVNDKNQLISYSIGEEVDTILGLQNNEKNYNVILCNKQLIDLFLSGKKGEQFRINALSIIYNFLTKRPEYSKLILNSSNENVLADLQKRFDILVEWYKSVIISLEKYFDNESGFYTDSNPGWFSIKQKKEKIDGVNYKLYTTFPVKQYSFISKLIDLSLKLDELSRTNNDFISIKIPKNLLGFLTHSDSLVIHFKNKNNRFEIEKILNEWISSNMLIEENRNLGRTKFAIDSKDKLSFSELISKNISNWLSENYGKYDNKLLVDLAIKYTIEAGQNVPKINGEKLD
ncbi:MAG: hypothetical protein PHS49_03880 [Candidatus Gracilibacteria bacterium]|nr:hypothetical protein [Candidatus Gracilibacteria bacterium]